MPLRSGEYFLGFSFSGESRFFWRRKQRAAFHLLRINGGGEEEGRGGGRVLGGLADATGV